MSASPEFPKLPKGWSEFTETLQTSPGPVFYREYLKGPVPVENQTRRFLFVVHGFGEQSDRFEHFPFYLSSELDGIGLIDLPGHGKSSGQRGHIQDFELCTQAALAGFANFQRRRADPKAQFHWMGASMGGLVTLRTLLTHSDLNLKSVIVNEAQIDLALKVPVVKEKLAEIMESIWGNLSMGNELQGIQLTKIKSVQDEYFRNPLNHTRITPRTFCNMKREMLGLRQNSRPMNYSFLMMTPLEDKIVSWKAQFKFFENLKLSRPTDRKSLQSFPDFNHELFNESGKELCFNALSSWLNSF
jgi:alpha-beta hydrolase superfamily lysophospholipase